MDKQQEIAKTLEARLAELTAHVAEIDSEMRKSLPADSEEQAIDLEGQDALEGIEKTKLEEIRQIKAALQRIADGGYGFCTQCGEPIAAKRLAALPTATRCIACAT